MNKNRKEIYQELEELKSPLAQLKKPVGAIIPDAYFENLPDQVIASCNSSRSSEAADLVQTFKRIILHPRNIGIAASFLILIFAVSQFGSPKPSLHLNIEELDYDEMIGFIMDDVGTYDMEALFDIHDDQENFPFQTFDFEDEALNDYLQNNLEYIDTEFFEDITESK